MALLRRKDDDVLHTVKDPLGRTVVLRRQQWRHVRKHEQLDGHELAVMRAVENADRKRAGNKPNREVVYGENLGPALWLAVVVEYDGMHGHVVTAYPQNAEPKA